MLAAAALAAGALAWFRPFRVEIAGDSMRPALEAGDWAMATARGRVSPGDVVVAERPDRSGLEIVKRVAARESDGWILLGDNPEASTDSRSFGPITGREVTGRVRVVYWPLWRIGRVPRGTLATTRGR